MNIIKKIQTIFQKKFRIDIAEEYFSKDLSLGYSGIGFNAIEMLYFIHYIEDEFNIKFTAEHFTAGKIRTLSGICAAIDELRKETIIEVEKIS
jgi:acyl carrier protein